MTAGATIESAMTPYPYSIEMNAHISSAKAMLTQFGIRHLPVTDGEKLTGIITLRDIKRAETCGVDTSVGSDVRVEKLCNRDVYIVAPEESLASVARQMAERYIDSALVARNGRLAGIFTFSDALKRYADLLSGTAPRR
jgi:CBS domain-containing protein